MYISVSKGALFASLAFSAWVGTLVPATSADLGPHPREPLVEPAPPPSQWQFSFTPYGWATSINGSATARGHTVDIDESFIEIVEKSDSLMALMGYFEARKGPFALFTDVVWADLTFDGRERLMSIGTCQAIHSPGCPTSTRPSKAI
jgi:hypothetical protein